uniref:Uncharacterized protein n=1 Tax=Anguilla anguilla TaxID=7936 RepID=A0A0E9QCC4_ANGAN
MYRFHVGYKFTHLLGPLPKGLS